MPSLDFSNLIISPFLFNILEKFFNKVYYVEGALET